MKTQFGKMLGQSIGESRLAIVDLVDIESMGEEWARELDVIGADMIITRINVPEGHRRQGVGTELLRETCDAADEDGVTLCVQAVSSGEMKNDQLIAWYSRFGFVSTSKYEEVMVRKPKFRHDRLRKEIERLLESEIFCEEIDKVMPDASLADKKITLYKYASFAAQVIAKNVKRDGLSLDDQEILHDAITVGDQKEMEDLWRTTRRSFVDSEGARVALDKMYDAWN